MKTLETERLILRKYTENDFPAVHSYGSCVENIIYMPFGPNTEEQTWDFIKLAIDKAEETPITHYQYAVELKENGRFIGGCGINLSNVENEIGWLVLRDFWKEGFGTEMGKELLRFGFEELNLHRIIARCDAENIGSYKIMEKLGMRREGLSLESRPAHKLSDKKYGDELLYAILKDEWETQKEIAYYKTLPVVFDNFIELPELSDGVIHLVCTAKNQAIPEKKYVPSYDFAVCKGSEKIGEIHLRIGYSGFGPDESSLYYGGQIGYGIDEEFRGNGYAVRACKLLGTVAKAHDMTKLLITNDYTNTASRRVCEKLGTRFIRMVRLPEWTDLYKEGQRYIKIYEWSVA